MISPSHRPLPDNTQHSQHTNIHSGPFYLIILCVEGYFSPGYTQCHTHTQTHAHSIGLVWTRVWPIAETSICTTHNTGKTKTFLSQRDSNSQSQQASGRTPGCYSALWSEWQKLTLVERLRVWLWLCLGEATKKCKYETTNVRFWGSILVTGYFEFPV